MVAVCASFCEGDTPLHRAHVAPSLPSPQLHRAHVAPPLPSSPLPFPSHNCTELMLPLPSSTLFCLPFILQERQSCACCPFPPHSSPPHPCPVSRLCEATGGHCKACMQDYKPNARDWLSSYWKGFMSPDQMARIRNTGVPMDFLKEVLTTSNVPLMYRQGQHRGRCGDGCSRDYFHSCNRLPICLCAVPVCLCACLHLGLLVSLCVQGLVVVRKLANYAKCTHKNSSLHMDIGTTCTLVNGKREHDILTRLSIGCFTATDCTTACLDMLCNTWLSARRCEHSKAVIDIEHH